MSDPIVKIFTGVNYPILTTTDVFKGVWRGSYEGFRGRPLKTVMAHTLSQIAGSAVGRAADSGDDYTGIAQLQGNNLPVQIGVSSLVSGGIDYAMGRGGKMERFIVPAVIDGVVSYAGPMMYSSDPRIL
jgi:hypothetical protein